MRERLWLEPLCFGAPYRVRLWTGKQKPSRELMCLINSQGLHLYTCDQVPTREESFSFDWSGPNTRKNSVLGWQVVHLNPDVNDQSVDANCCSLVVHVQLEATIMPARASRTSRGSRSNSVVFRELQSQRKKLVLLTTEGEEMQELLKAHADAFEEMQGHGNHAKVSTSTSASTSGAHMGGAKRTAIMDLGHGDGHMHTINM